MAKTAQEFLSQLDASGLVPPEVLENLRKQVAKAAKPVSTGTLARVLVDHGHLTDAQGERLAEMPLPASKKSSSASGVLGLEPIGESSPSGTKSVAKAPTKGPPKSQAEIDAAAAALGLAPIYEAPKSGPASKPATPAKVASTKTAPPAKPTSRASSGISKAKPLPTAAPLVEGLEPLTPLPGDDLFAAAPLTAGPLAADPFAAVASPVSAKKTAPPLALADPLALDPLTAAAAPLAVQHPVSQPPAAKSPAPPKPRSRAWLGIAVAIAILLTGGGISGYLFVRSNGDKEVGLAEQDYTAKQYDAAAEKYSTFLADFPANAQAGTARIHRAMAKILAASPGKDNPSAMLAAAKASLPEVGGEPGLSQLHAELAPLLSDMAVALMEKARQGKSVAESEARLAEARDALALANDGRFVPGALRRWQRLAEVEENLTILERDLGRAKALEDARADIRKRAQGGKLEEALAQRQKLLAAYPELAADDSLRNLGNQLAKTLAASVKTKANALKAETAEPDSPVLASIALFSGKPLTAAAGPEKTFVVMAAGSVWALNAGSGKLLWSRPAQSSVSTGDGDVLISGNGRQEIACVNSRTGALNWRHALKEPLVGSPLVVGDKVVAATRTGEIFSLSIAGGGGLSSAALPQGVRVSLSADESGQRLFQVADQAFLYILSADLKCDSAVYLGHEPGSVEVPPTPLAQHVVVAVNRAASALLLVVPLDEKGLATGSAQQIEVPGLVATPPVLIGERLIVLTDRQTSVFEYQPGETETLKKLSELETPGAEGVARHGAVLGGKLWTAGDGLRRFDFNPSGGTLTESWTGFAADSLDTLPGGADDVVFCIRHGTTQPGAIAATLKAGTGEVLWETILAQPLSALDSSADGTSATATTLSWAAAKLEVTSLSGPSVQPFAIPESSSSMRVLDSPLAAPPLVWSGGRLCITATGSVHLLDHQTGAPLAEPFQLGLRAGTALDVCSAAPAGAESVVVQAGPASLYHLRLEKVSQPHLALVAKAVLKSPAISRVAAGANSAYVVDETGTLQILSLPEFKPAKMVKLGCRAVVHGPTAAGNNLFLESDSGDLLCLDEEGKQLWKVSLAEGSLAGKPLNLGSDLLVPLKTGVLIRVSAAGKEIARADAGQSLAGDGVLAGDAVLLPTAAGGILKVALPEKK